MPRIGQPPVHTHGGNGVGGQLDWDDVWSDAVHSHASAAEGGQVGHGDLSGVTSGQHHSLLHTHASAGEGGTLGLVAIPSIVVARKAADETINNLTSAQDDDDLKLIVAASEVWAFDFTLRVNSSAGADIYVSFGVPSGATAYWRGEGGASETELTTGNSAIQTSGANQIIRISGVIIVGATAGTLTLRWAQNLAEVSDTKVMAGSLMIAHKLA